MDILTRPSDSTNSLGAHSEAAGLQIQLQFADTQQAYITSYIQLADTKCAWSFAASAALTAYIITNTSSSPLLLDGATGVVRGLGLISLALLIASAAYAFLGIAPRLKSSRSTDPFFFGTVARHGSPGQFAQQISSLSLSDVVAIRLRHNFDIARACTRKYFFVKASLWIGIAGAICLGLALLLNKCG